MIGFILFKELKLLTGLNITKYLLKLYILYATLPNFKNKNIHNMIYPCYNYTLSEDF